MGKTATISVLNSIASFEFVCEDVTFGDFMSRFWENPDLAAADARANLLALLNNIEGRQSRVPVLLERHFSPIAVGSNADEYRDVNEKCVRLRCKVAALFVPDALLASRSLYRAEHGGRDWQNMIGRYGSEEGALDGLRSAQAMRIEALRKSGLEYKLIDTSEKAWNRYAKEIARWAGW